MIAAIGGKLWPERTSTGLCQTLGSTTRHLPAVLRPSVGASTASGTTTISLLALLIRIARSWAGSLPWGHGQLWLFSLSKQGQYSRPKHWPEKSVGGLMRAGVESSSAANSSICALPVMAHIPSSNAPDAYHQLHTAPALPSAGVHPWLQAQQRQPTGFSEIQGTVPHSCTSLLSS